MQTIERTNQFKRDYKRELKGKYRTTLADDIRRIVTSLISDQTLEARYPDHALTGEWKDHRDCHIRPDLILIYQKPDACTLRLVRLGSHSALGL